MSKTLKLEEVAKILEQEKQLLVELGYDSKETDHNDSEVNFSACVRDFNTGRGFRKCLIVTSKWQGNTYTCIYAEPKLKKLPTADEMMFITCRFMVTLRNTEVI